MKLFLLLISTAGYLGFISRQPTVGFYRAPFIFCCFVTLSLYITAIIGHLQAGLWVTVTLGVALAIREVTKWILKGASPTLTSSLWKAVCFLPFIWYYFAIDAKFNFLLWDEFTFWASSAKIIYETNALFQADSPIFLKSYPPAQQLFQYYFTQLGGWSEKNVLFAQGVWLLAGLLCIAGSLVKRPVNVVVTFLVSIIFLYYFEYSFSSIYSDALLGVTFAVGVALTQTPDRSKVSIFALILTLATLVLIKEIAIALAFVVCGVYVVVALVDRATAAGEVKKPSFLSIGKYAIYLSVTIVLAQRSWAWYVSTLQGTRQPTSVILDQLNSAAAGGRVEQTWTEFLTRILKPGYLKLSFEGAWASPAIWLTVLLLVLLVVISLKLSPSVSRRRMAAGFAILYAGAIAYTATLFVSFLVFFTEYEGLRLASFERYLSTYILALSLLGFALYMSTFDAKPTLTRYANQIAVAILAFLIAPPLFTADLKGIKGVGDGLTMRRDTEAFAAQVKRHIQPGQSVYFVAQNSNGFERGMFYYAMLPYATSTGWCWSFGQKYYDGDVWTCDKNIAELVQGYDYLALYFADKQFWDMAGDLFEPSARGVSHGVFRINRGSAGANVFTELK